MEAPEFSRDAQLLSRAALPALAAARPARDDSVLQAAPAAALLLRPDAAPFAALAEGLRRLADLGRRHAASAGGGAAGSFPGAGTLPRHAPGGSPRLVDALGHARPVYHPLALHLHLAAFAAHYEAMPVALWSACEDALPDAVFPVRGIEAFADKPPPPEHLALTLWQALCLLEAAKLAARDVDVEIADAVVHRALRRPGAGGALHPQGPGDDASLDDWTYRELCGLHALANLAASRAAVQGPFRQASAHPAWWARVQEVARYHLEHTQPDHATTQPWGIGAFLCWPATRSFGEQQLHDAAAHGAGEPSGVAALLLADAARLLREKLE